jgi:hypothetical protein
MTSIGYVETGVKVSNLALSYILRSFGFEQFKFEMLAKYDL